MASPRGAYTPKTGSLAGQTFGSYYQYQNARSQQLGFSGYTEERTFRLNEAVRENILRLFPGYPEDRMANVMQRATIAQKTRLRRAEHSDLDADDLGVDTSVYYHE